MSEQNQNLNHDPAIGLFDMLSPGIPPTGVYVLMFNGFWFMGEYQEEKGLGEDNGLYFYEEGTGWYDRHGPDQKWIVLPSGATLEEARMEK